MKERVLAVVGAIVLIVGALVLRSQLATDDGPGTTKRSNGTTGVPVIACTSDLMAVCEALADDDLIAADPPTVDLADAAEPESGIDGWITWDPSPGIVDFDAPGTWTDSVGLASAEVALVMPGPVRKDLSNGCGSAISWSCVADAAGDSSLRLGVGDPTTAEGLARLAPLGPSLADDGDYTRLDGVGLRTTLAGPQGGQDSLEAQLGRLNQPGFLDAVVGPIDRLEVAASTAAGKRRDLVAVVPTPATSVGIVLATREGADLGGLAAAARTGPPAEALVALGFEPGNDAPAADDLAGALFQIRKAAT